MRPGREALIELGATELFLHKNELIRVVLKASREEYWRDQDERTKQAYRDQFAVALAAIEAHSGGLVISPKRPTDDMNAAVEEHVLNEDDMFEQMLAASPYAPQQKE